MQKSHILWADDEIDLLKPHIRFLETKGYEVTSVPSGTDALELCQEGNAYDIVFLDENMPGMTGLETLAHIKSLRPNLPVVMITKSEEEHIMEDAIGSRIDDYLIKPLNPNQILLSVKKILDNKRLVSERTNQGYQQDFRNLSMAYNDRIGHTEWADIYKKLVFWETGMDQSQSRDMGQVFSMQKEEANNNFSKFIEEEYEDWLNEPKADAPVMSHQLMKKCVLPLLDQQDPLFFILIDNLRLDQWRAIQPQVEELFRIEQESTYFSILPTATAFARNAIFSGLMPSQMEKQHSDIWVGDENDEEGKNNHEEEFLRRHLKTTQWKDTKLCYYKILNTQQGRDLVDKVHTLWSNQLNVIVYNFVDMLSHARTETTMIRELVPDESAYRSLTQSWFTHSPLLEIMRAIARKGGRMVITTDHGTVRVQKPFRIVGDRSVNSNLRYKQGKNLGFDKSHDIMVVNKPERLFLPKPNVSTAYVFAKENVFLTYPNNYNHYVNYYKDTFQHGGISMEEMILPFIYLKAR